LNLFEQNIQKFTDTWKHILLCSSLNLLGDFYSKMYVLIFFLVVETVIRRCSRANI